MDSTDRKIIMTGDGSHSVDWNGETYHSIHGAIRESMHVFIREGLHAWLHKKIPGPVRIFEMGLGTGLNALLTLLESETWPVSIDYEAIEPFPLDEQVIARLNYCALLNRPDLQSSFDRIHHSPWNIPIPLTSRFNLRKRKRDLQSFVSVNGPIDLVYFDAFAPDVQPELWTLDVFRMLFDQMAPGGFLTTYSSKGDVRRNLEATGFRVEKIPGPPHKREMTRARKPGHQL